MKPNHSERGQALIMIVFAAIGLFAFTALAIDGSRVFSDRRHAQNAADTAALAAALAQVRGGDYVNAATLRAESNGFTSANSTVEIHLCNETGLNPPCEGLPAGADSSQYIQIVIRLTTPTTFARILGWQEVPSVVSAIARAVTGVPGGSMQSPAISAMSPTDEKAFWGNGNFTLNIHNSGVFVNSENNCGLVTSGASGSYHVDTSYDVVGDYCWSGQPTLQPANSLNRDAEPMPYPPAINIPEPSITCSGDTQAAWVPAETAWVVPAGNHPSPMPIPGGTVRFAAGNHCFPNGFSIGGTSNVEVNNANFLISGGEFHMSGNSGLSICNGLLVHVKGGTGMRLNGNGNYNCAGVTFYMNTGNVTWNGNSANTFSAPTGGTYRGLLLYLPYGNSSPVTVSGNAGSQFTGSIIAVSSDIHLQGNPTTLALSTKIIGYRVQFSGNGTFEINYDPSQQFAQGEPTMIQVIK